MENNIQSFLQTDGLTTQLCMYTTAMFEFGGATVAQMAIVLVSLEVIGLGFTQDYSWDSVFHLSKERYSFINIV